MTRLPLRALTLAGAALVLALVVAACGSSNDDNKGSSGGGGGNLPTSAPSGAKQGGTLKVLSNGDVDFIDPGLAYYQYTYMVSYATVRPLFSFKPDETSATPDFAASPAQISDGGKTITVKTRSGIKFSPPVNRAATAKDVKYGIERTFTKAVPNGYAPTYWGDLEGLKAFQDGKAKDISGIEVPDDTTIVFHLTKPTAGGFVGALSLPASAPVPEEYAKQYDAKNPSTYGQHQVATGPYMIQTYKPGKSIILVRNPNWDKSTDRRPAYLDRIDFQEGIDPAVGGKQILNGQSQVNGDFAPLPQDDKLALSSKRSQIQLVPGAGNRYVAMNTKEKPFDDVNVRKAVVAIFDRNAMRLTRGGPAIGDIATHFLMPGVAGFDQAGGLSGPELDYIKNPAGDPKVAADYMKKAGFANGKFSGPSILMVGTSEGVGKKSAEVAQAQFEKLGFQVKLRLVTTDSMYTKFCNVPKAKVSVCPNVGWIKDFPDGQSVLDATFNGKNIVETNNSNWPQLDDPGVNAAIEKAKLISDPKQRADAWGKIDDQIMALAPAIPWLWDKQPNIQSSNVNGVITLTNANYDINYTSLK
jgi:peptide/nickel transport system substrate-binding protein